MYSVSYAHTQYTTVTMLLNMFIAVNYLQGPYHHCKLISHQSDASVVAHHVPVYMKCITQ